MNIDADVIIVGAGPIGLAHAWGIKKLNPKLKVLVLEKYASYQREHTLDLQYKQLEKLIHATGAKKDPDLAELLKKLKLNSHIRTNELQDIFTKVAKDSGVEICVKNDVTDKTIDEQLFGNNSKARLIIGADGTRSVVNRTLFPKGNQVKHEFDYALQLRYDIEGDGRADANDPVDFYEDIARHGLLANEYVGRFDIEKNKTPVTMQIIISKDDYEALKPATSKNPFKPYAGPEGTEKKDEDPEGAKIKELPEQLQKFVTNYLAKRVKACQQNGFGISPDKVRVSVNELPAMHVKSAVRKYMHKGVAVPVVLVGDAGLALSYFKGLNAGLESTAMFLSEMKSVLMGGFSNPEFLNKALARYESWFLDDFSPKKVQEVANYSTWKVRLTQGAMNLVHNLKMTTMNEHFFDQQELIADYFAVLAQDARANHEKDKTWHLYLHRDYDLVKLGQFAYIPFKHTLKKMGKIFIDYIKPYKSIEQLKQDFKQPMVSIINLGSGLVKIVKSFFKLDYMLFGDGIFTLARGIIELATTPITWLLKPISRGIITAWGGFAKLEDNAGLKKVVQKGRNLFDKISRNTNAPAVDEESTYRILAICNDIHRKFDKAKQRKQKSRVKPLEEFASYAAMRAEFSKETVAHYLSLFPSKIERGSSLPRIEVCVDPRFTPQALV